MLLFDRQVDEWILIGRKIKIWPTDIDARSIRLMIDGEVLGGPDDGARIHKACELTIGSIVQVGPQVTIHVLNIYDSIVRLGIESTRTMTIEPEEGKSR